MIYKDIVLAAFFMFFLITGVVDLASDLDSGVSKVHFYHELVVIFISLVALFIIIKSLMKIKKYNENLEHELDIAKQKSQNADIQVRELRSELKNVVEKQFLKWRLSKSESEVGLLLLKGLSLKEIAILRHTQEKTVRTQASAIYRKASLDGRHAFAAWFLEDII